MKKVVLVDENDKALGVEEKIKAHQEGRLHRAFSVFVFNSRSELLLQKRAKGKYHSGGLWTNTCCSHPGLDEPVEKAAHYRLEQEMGFDCPLQEIFSFIYRAEFENGLTENEYDHVFLGRFDGQPMPNPEEAEDWKWISLAELKKDIQENPQAYTSWFKICLDKVISELNEA